jgi:hypothetical protein
MPISFSVVRPNKSLRGFLNIYIIPKGKKIIGRNIINCVMISEIIAIDSDTKEAIQITN